MTAAIEEQATIAAIVILYLPSEKKLTRLLHSLHNTVQHIFVIDNTPTHQALWVSNDWFIEHGFNIQYRALGDNFGIAKAQNVGIDMAVQSGCDHIVLFDQDSEASPGMVATLLAEECSLLSQDVKVGSVGPAFVDEKTGDYAAAAKQGWFFVKRIPIQAGDTKPISVDVLISSGTLIRTQVLKDVGMMMEELFIDWVDIEWALRAGRYHYAHFMIPKAIMRHTIGDDFVDVGVRKVNIHSDFRKYYIIRNACFLLTTREMQFKWRVNTVFKILAYMLIYLFTSKNKIKLSRLMFSAIISGFSGRLGKQFFMIPML